MDADCQLYVVSTGIFYFLYFDNDKSLQTYTWRRSIFITVHIVLRGYCGAVDVRILLQEDLRDVLGKVFVLHL